MKISLHALLVVLFVGQFMACGSQPAVKEEKETPAKPTTEQAPAGFITGTVQAIQQGKDGYTAKILSDTTTYFATISHSNLTNPAQYRTIKVGDTITVKGDPLKIGNEAHITVRELK